MLSAEWSRTHLSLTTVPTTIPGKIYTQVGAEIGAFFFFTLQDRSILTGKLGVCTLAYIKYSHTHAQDTLRPISYIRSRVEEYLAHDVEEGHLIV